MAKRKAKAKPQRAARDGWQRVSRKGAPAQYERDGEVIRKFRRHWQRGGTASTAGFYGSLKAAKAAGKRRLWIRDRPGNYLRVDGYRVISRARRGASGCWTMRDPSGSDIGSVYGSRKQAIKAAPPVRGAVVDPNGRVRSSASRGARAAVAAPAPEALDP